MQRKSVWVAMALAVALLGAGCSHGPNDQQIATHLKSEMFSDPQLKDSTLSVSVKNGVATLSGRVSSVAARYEAFKTAAETPGVKKVSDQMTVEEPAMSNTSAANLPQAKPAPKPKPRVRRHHLAHHTESAPAETQPASPPTAVPAPAPAPPAQQMANQEPANQPANAQPEPSSSTAEEEPPAPPPIEVVTVKQGTHVSVRMIDSIDSAVNHTGDIFHASLASPLVVGKKVIAPTGTNVYLRLVEARSAGHMAGQSELRVELYRLVLNGKSYPLVSNDYEVKGRNRTKRSALAIIGGAVAGAAIGAIAGGGKGAAIGAAAGGGSGAAYERLSKSKQVTIPSESLLHFHLDQPLDITLTLPPSNPPNSNPNPNPNPLP